MRSRYSQITVFVLNAISNVFTNVTYTVIICIKSSKEDIVSYIKIAVFTLQTIASISAFIPSATDINGLGLVCQLRRGITYDD